MKKLLGLALVFVVTSMSAFAQLSSLSGVITDSETGEFLPGANIFIQELSTGTVSDLNGVYTIANLLPGTYTVRYSYVGYRTIEEVLTLSEGDNTFDVELRLDAAGLQEIVVTGIGTIERQAFTGTATTVRSDRFQNVPVASFDQALMGAAPGVTVNSATGTPGAVQQIRVRGISSVNAGVSPLFVIDGVPVVSGSNASSGATSSFGIFANLNPGDIESVTVLKDATATAPYGAQGSNGVIVITTKQGRQGRTDYSVNVSRGINNRAVPGEGAMGAIDYDDITKQMYGGSSLVDFGLWDGVTDTDWGAVVTNEDAINEEYTVSARGGNGITNFYVSGNVFRTEGAVIGSSVDRLAGKVDIVHRFDDRVRMSNGLSLSFAEQDGFLEGAGYFGSPILAEYFMLPVRKAFNDDGTPNLNVGIIFNPVYIQENDINRKRNYRLLNNTKLDVNLAPNLSFSSRVSLDYLETVEKYFRNRNYGDARPPTGGSVTDNNNRNINIVWQNIVEYIYDMNEDNTFTFKALSETQKNNFEYLSAYGTGIAADGLVNLNTTASPQGVSGYTTDWGVQSFTGLVNYGFQDKLYSDVSFRYEGNSRFASDKRWGSFWSFGLAYVLTEEEFLSNVSFLDYLRVKASVGKTGNASIGLNAYQATVGFGGYNDQPTILTSQLGNKDLSWETALAYDLGLEFEFLQKISGGLTFYRKDSKDLLFSVPLSLTTGHSSQTQNIGELYNQGIELDLSFNVVRTRDFGVTLGGNLTTVKNEVTKLPTDAEGNDIEITTSTRYTAVEGYAVNTWFMREWAGVDPENGDPLWVRVVDGERTTTNNYNLATPLDQGATALPKLFGSFDTRIDVKNFYVSANMYYAFDYKIFDNWAFYLRSDGRYIGSFGLYDRQKDRWQQPGDIAENPKPVAGGNKNSNQASSRFLYDGDHIRLKNLRVGYAVPARYLENIGLTSANVYFVGTNLWTYAFDEDLKYDPEARADGFTSLQAPPMKSVSFGISFNF